MLTTWLASQMMSLSLFLEEAKERIHWRVEFFKISYLAIFCITQESKDS
jgi:hypothetical protein